MYQLDTEAAKQADNRSSRIDETGAYAGVIVRAVEIPANEKGTKGLYFDFKADDGREAWLPLYTHNGKGETLPAFKTVNAIMTCAKVRTLTPTKATIRAWDNDARTEVDKVVNVFNEIGGKRIGVFLEMETSTYQGKTKTRPVLAGAFEADTKFTAKEILEKATKAETYDKWVKSLKDRVQRDAASTANKSGTPSGGHAIPFDDDIPFN